MNGRSVNTLSTTPRKIPKTTKNLQLPELAGIVEEEATPAFVRCALGPTPQKDGEVLGIFDALPMGTPSKGGDVSTVDPEHVVGATPSKPVASSFEQALSKTPQSSGKRFYLGAFAGTPLKRKRGEEVYTPSTAKRQYATPAFLRRSFTLSAIHEDKSEAMTADPPFKKRGLVRSLSTIIQGLKKQEEQRMDDEWEIMNEIEAEERGEKVPKVIVEDSQVAEMPLGPDKGDESGGDTSEADPGALDANGKPRKVWKKKGLKRQTRRVKMRPVTHKAKKAADAELSDSEPELVEETQQPEQAAGPERCLSEEQDRDVGDDAEGSDYQNDRQQSHHERAQKRSKKQKKAEPNDGNSAEADEQGGVTSKKPRKVNALAHTNFRKLKIKNKNSKANGRGRKFGRR